jgi:hypothetical protein
MIVSSTVPNPPRRHDEGVRGGMEQRTEALDVFLVVQGFEQRLARVLPASILAFQVALLETEGVAHDHPSEVEGLLGAEDRAPVTALRERTAAGRCGRDERG